MREVNEANILSPEEQKHFDKIMNEYNEQSQRVNKSLYQSNMSISTKNNRNLVLGGIIVLFAISIYGLWNSFQGMSEETKPPAPVAVQDEQPSPSETENKYLEEQEELRKTEELKNNFHPFDGTEEQPPMNSTESYIPPTEYPHVLTEYPVENNINPNNYDKNFYQEERGLGYGNSESIPQPTFPELKGIAQSNDGIVCYIEYNGHTGTYKIGNKVGEYTIKNITTSQVILVDSTGKDVYLTK